MPSIITLSSLCTFPWPGKVGSKKESKKNEEKKRCNWIMSWHSLQKKECQALRCLTHFLLSPSPSPPLSLISFLPLIYSKAALWLSQWCCSELCISVKSSAIEPKHILYTQPDLQYGTAATENRKQKMLWTDSCAFCVIVCVYPVQGRNMYCMCSSVSIVRGLCSNRGGSIIDYSLAGNILLLISNKKKKSNRTTKNIFI